MSALKCFTEPGVMAQLLAQVPVTDALRLAQVSKAMNEAVRGASRYWYLQCCTVKNMRGQKVNNYTDYRRLFLTTRWQKQRQTLWSAKDQKHWSRVYRRKQIFDQMEDALGERQEIELLRDVIKQETDKLLTGNNTEFFLEVGRQLSQTECSCKGKVRDNCAKHDKLCVRTALHKHMAAWINDSLRLGSNKEYVKTMKLFDDKVRAVWKNCSRLKSKRFGPQIHFETGRGTLVYTVETDDIRVKKGT